MEDRKFKVGDLVTVCGLEGFSFYSYLKDGSCGVVTEVLPLPGPDKPYSETFFFDYRILIDGQEYYIFEDEMKEYQPTVEFCESCECDPCDCHWGIE